MHNIVVFSLILFSISAINTMDKQNDCANRLMDRLPDDLIIYHIGPRLDRLDRNNFRLINKRYSHLILCQALLNADYAWACEDNNTLKIVECRKQGALKLYEEVCALALHKLPNRRILAKKICSRYPNASITIDGLAYAIRQNDLAFARWILDVSKPDHWSRGLRSSIKFSKKLNRDAITRYLKNYIDQKEHNEKLSEIYTRYITFGTL